MHITFIQNSSVIIINSPVLWQFYSKQRKVRGMVRLFMDNPHTYSVSITLPWPCLHNTYSNTSVCCGQKKLTLPPDISEGCPPLIKCHHSFVVDSDMASCLQVLCTLSSCTPNSHENDTVMQLMIIGEIWIGEMKLSSYCTWHCDLFLIPRFRTQLL